MVALLASAGVVGAAAWRVLTAGFVGADIGGGVVGLLGPLVIAGLLLWAARIAAAAGHQTRWRTRLLTLAAALTAPVVYAVLLSGWV